MSEMRIVGLHEQYMGKLVVGVESDNLHRNYKKMKLALKC